MVDNLSFIVNYLWLKCIFGLHRIKIFLLSLIVIVIPFFYLKIINHYFWLYFVMFFSKFLFNSSIINIIHFRVVQFIFFLVVKHIYIYIYIYFYHFKRKYLDKTFLIIIKLYLSYIFIWSFFKHNKHYFKLSFYIIL